jgi:predicted  nucleic acid-binding Zn-ribbon protein
MSWDAETLAQQLAQLGRDLQEEITLLGELEEECVTAEGEYRRLQDLYEDEFHQAFINLPGSVESRKAAARLECVTAREASSEAYLQWNRLKGQVRVQNASLSALRSRIDIGRSLLSREKSLLSLAGTGEV